MNHEQMATPLQKVKLKARSSYFAVATVLRLNPKLFAASVLNEIISRTTPFIEAALSGKLVSLLPKLLDHHSRAVALHSMIYVFVALLIVRLVNMAQGSLYRVYEQRQEVELQSAVSRQLYEKFSRLPYALYEDKNILDQYDLATSYAGQISNFVLYRMREVGGSVYTLILAALAFLHFSWPLAVGLAVVAVPQFWLELKAQRAQNKAWRSNTVTRRKAVAYEDLLRPIVIKDTRLFGLAQHVIDKAFHYQKQSQSEQTKIELAIDKFRISLGFLDTIIETGVLVFVVRQIYRGLQPIGQFVYVQQVVNQYTSALTSLTWSIQSLDEFILGATEFHAFMELSDLKPGKGEFETANVVFDDVSFTYPHSKLASLKHISLTIPRGKTIAIVGANGAGKTTLIKLLMKLYDPTSGAILIGKDNLGDIDESAWHDKLGVLFQDFVTFMDFTIGENVQFGRLSAGNDIKRINTALKRAGVLDFVQLLPKGIDTYLGKYMDEENGTLLSGGQLQRLAIARILFRDPEILIMDEPTSAVDAQAEYEIFKELDKLRASKTTILISHRFSTVRKADYIYVLDRGMLVEEGTHHDLMSQDGRYARMFSSQAEAYIS